MNKIWIFEFVCTILSNLNHPTKILATHQTTPRPNLLPSNKNLTFLIRTILSKYPALKDSLPQDPNQPYKMPSKPTVNFILPRPSVKYFHADAQETNQPSKD